MKGLHDKLVSVNAHLSLLIYHNTEKEKKGFCQFLVLYHSILTVLGKGLGLRAQQRSRLKQSLLAY